MMGPRGPEHGPSSTLSGLLAVARQILQARRKACQTDQRAVVIMVPAIFRYEHFIWIEYKQKKKTYTITVPAT
jgi:hypothetical protein